MAMLVAIAGGVIGSFFGAPQLGFLAGSLLGSVLFSGSNRGGPKLADLHVSSSTYGKPIIWGWGTGRVGGNIIQAGLLVQHAHTQGKGGALGTGTSYTYSSTHAVGLCATDFTGPIQSVLKIWADTKLVYDATGQSGVSQNIPGGGGGKGGGNHFPAAAVVNGGIVSAFNQLGVFRVYTGSTTQLPDAALEALQTDPTDQCAYRGLAYVVMDDIDLENYGNRVPNWTFEVVFANNGNPLSQNSFKFNFNTSVVGPPDSTNVALDSFRQRAYFFDIGGSGTAGTHAMSLATGNEVFSVTATQSFSTGVYPSGNIDFWSTAPIVGNDGYLYVWGNGANYSPILKVDPNNMLVVGACGTPNAFAPTNGSVSLYDTVVPITISNTNCLLTSGIFNDVYLTNTDSMTGIAKGTFPEGGALKLTGGVQTGAGSAVCYAKSSNGASSVINIYEVPVSLGSSTITPALIASITPSQIDSQWTSFFNNTSFLFDQTDGNVMFFAQFGGSVTAGHYTGYLIKVSTQTGAIIWRMPFPTGTYGNVPGNPDYINYQTIIGSGIYSFIDGAHNVWTVSTQDGSFTINPWGQHLSANPQAWADSFGAILFNGHFDPNGDGWQCLVTNLTEQSQALSTIVTQICEAVGYVSADLNVAALTDEVPGYILDQQMMAADAIRPLGTAYLFDGVESDYTLKFVKRGGASVATIPSTDLAYLDSKLNEIIEETRTQEVDLPNQISINFLDPNHNYQSATQYSRRPKAPFQTMFSNQVITQNLALVEQPGFMKQLCDKILYTTWIERVGYKTHLPWSYLVYDPTDILTLTLTDGSTMTTRMVTCSIGADWTMEWQSVSESAPSYSSSAATSGGDGFIQQLLAIASQTRLFLLDIPLLRDSDDTGQSFTILYDAASGWGPTWAGCVPGKSIDDVNWTNQTTIPTSQAAIWGTANNKLGDVANPWTWDYVNTLTVTMVNGGSSLASATPLEVCNGANAGVLYNSSGVPEIIQWQTVTTNADGSYTLSNLLRGRRGTEVFTGTHQFGDTFIVCTPENMATITMSLSDINVGRFFRAVTNGTVAAQANVVNFTDTGRTWMPYAPGHVNAVLDISSNIQINWVRRTRVGGEMRDLTGDVPLAEQSEAYQVDIYNALGNTVLRTLTVSYPTSPAPSPGVLYTAAQITADFGSTPTSLNLAVYQMSTIVGRGFGKQQTVTVM